MAMNRIRLLRLRPPPVSADAARDSPYALRLFRRWIDGGAFRIYGHWVKRGDNQNRAALFENAVKRDMKPVVDAKLAAAASSGHGAER